MLRKTNKAGLLKYNINVFIESGKIIRLLWYKLSMYISINVKNYFFKCRSYSLITMQWVGKGENQLKKSRAKAGKTLWTCGLNHTWRQFNSRLFGYFHQKPPTLLFVHQVFCHSQQKYSNTIIWKFCAQSNYKLNVMKIFSDQVSLS